MTEPIVIQFNCPKCRDADWGRGTEWVTVDRDLLQKLARNVYEHEPLRRWTLAESAQINKWAR